MHTYLLRELSQLQEQKQMEQHKRGQKNKQDTFQSCVPFANNITEISDILVDDAEHLCIMMMTYNLMKFRNIYAKTSKNTTKILEMIT